VSPSPRLKTETDPVPETSYFVIISNCRQWTKSRNPVIPPVHSSPSIRVFISVHNVREMDLEGAQQPARHIFGLSAYGSSRASLPLTNILENTTRITYAITFQPCSVEERLAGGQSIIKYSVINPIQSDARAVHLSRDLHVFSLRALSY
jgi:hypothetical protein